MGLPIKNMFYGKKRKQKRASSANQARFSQLYCSYKLYNISESVFSYMKRILMNVRDQWLSCRRALLVM